MKLIERETVMRDYGFTGTIAVVDHPVHGRLLIEDGYGGERSADGGAVRWQHGVAMQLLPTDTLAGLRDEANEHGVTAYARAKNGCDENRPVLEWSGARIDRIAKSVGL